MKLTENNIPIIATLILVSAWIVTAFIAVFMWVWFVQIDFDPDFHTDGAFVLTSIVFISSVHVLINIALTVMLFIPEAWAEDFPEYVVDYLDDLRIKQDE